LPPDIKRLTGVILAGGKARRMNGADKGLILLCGKPLIAHVFERLWPQVDDIVISANRNRDAYAAFGAPVLADETGDFAGPLAGIATALKLSRADAIVTAPCDGPWLPRDLVKRLRTCLEATASPVCVVHDGGRLQPAYAIIRRSTLPHLERYLRSGGRRLQEWLKQQHSGIADFTDQPEAFANINTPQDLAAAESAAAESHMKKPQA